MNDVFCSEQFGPTKQMRGIRSLNKLHEGIVRITAMYPDGSLIEPKGVNPKWHNDCGVLVREKCKIIWDD
jgi:hypothetical protein